MSCPFHGLFRRERSKNNADSSLQRTQHERRSLLKGIGALGGAFALGGSHPAMAAGSTLSQSKEDAEYTSRQMKQPFYGEHQSGILNPPPASAALIAFDVLAWDKNELTRLFKILTERCAFLTQGGEPPTKGEKFPPLDSGIVGTYVHPDNLTITVALGDSLFDERFGLGSVKPKHLQPMNRFPNDALDADWCHGDLLLQICANSQETVLHAMRDIIKHTPSLLSVRWRRDGFISNHVAATAGKETPINLLGFKDGTVNPNTRDKAEANRIILVSDQHDEPAWAKGGSYMAVRLIRFFVEQWDRTPLQEVRIYC